MIESYAVGMQDQALRLGLREAQKVNHLYKLAALVVKKHKIISLGVNRTKSDPLHLQIARMIPTYHKAAKAVNLHAEVSACSGLTDEELKGADIYVMRISKSKIIGNAKPCLACQAWLKSKSIRRAYFTVDYGGFDCIKL